jgi:hypothetical protein
MRIMVKNWLTELLELRNHLLSTGCPSSSICRLEIQEYGGKVCRPKKQGVDGVYSSHKLKV